MRTLIFTLSLFISSFSFSQSNNRFSLTGPAQGTSFSITYFHPSEIFTLATADSIFRSVDSSLSIYNPSSLISRFNKGNDPVPLDQHLSSVIRKALETYRLTGGAFDITIKPLMDAWGLGANGQAGPSPDSNTIHKILECIGSDKLMITDSLLVKLKPCIQIDVNGIAQGYTVDLLAQYLDKLGVNNYIIELGGEIKVKGNKPGGKPFTVGIEMPSDDLLLPPMIQQHLQLDSGAITTSGSYRKFIESNGKKINHIFDPKTGNSYQGNVLSVTVYAADAITADAFDNALLLMPLKESLAFVEDHQELAAYFIYTDNNGIIKGKASNRFKSLMK